MKVSYQYSKLKRIIYSFDRDDIFRILRDYIEKKNSLWNKVADNKGGQFTMDADMDDLGELDISIFQDFREVLDEDIG